MAILKKEQLKAFLKDFVKTIDFKIIFIATIVTAFILYYVNPLANVNLTEFNRTFSSSVMAGISINKRISNFYTLFFLYIPILLSILTIIFGLLFKFRENYKNAFFDLSIVMIFPTVISYVSRYTSEGEFNTNLFMIIMLAFYGILAIVAMLDKEKIFTEKHITLLCVSYLVGIITSNIIFNLPDTYIAMAIMSIFIMVYVFIILKTKFGKKILDNSFNYICFLAWIPALMMLLQEFIYLLNEKGFYIERHYTNIIRAIILYLVVALVIVFVTRKKKISFFLFGCLGIIISLSCTSFFSHSYFMEYQYGFVMNNYSNFYETGNSAVAIDSVKYGRVPILSNFSAHALTDVWTAILYSILHSDVKGILINPYTGLNTLIGVVLLFFIFKKLFGSEKGLLITCLFPINILGVKAVSVCLLPIVFLLNIINNRNIKNYLLFWIFTLVGAFTIYDEGISLGIACILAFAFILLLNQNWKDLIKFLVTGIRCWNSCIYFLYHLLYYSCNTSNRKN